MPLTLITGRANSGKTGELHTALRHTLGEGGRVALLLPSVPDVERATKEFRPESPAALTIATLDAFISQTWGLFGDGRRVVGNTVRPALLRQALHVPQETRLAAAMGTEGFVDLLEGLAQHTAGAPLLDGEDPTTCEIKRILAAYRQILADAGLIELGEAVSVLSSLVLQSVDLMLVNRFTDLSASQEEFLLGASKTVDVRASLPWEKGFPASESLNPLVERMAAAGTTIHIETRPPRTELDRLEAALYQPGVQPLISEDMLLLAEAAGDEAEIALVARVVANEVHAGRSPDRIAVVFRDAARRSEALVSALWQVNVRAQVDVSRGFAETEYGRATLGLLTQCHGGLPERIPLVGFLLSPYACADPERVHSLDANWRRHRIRGPQLMMQAIQELGGRTGRIISLARQVMGETYVRGNEEQWQELAGLLYASAQERFCHAEARLRRDAASQRALCRVISDASDALIGPGDSIGALARASVHEPPLDMGAAVHVTEAHRLRSSRFDVVILGGLTATEFSSDRPPSLKRELINQLSGSSASDDRLQERLMFYAVVSRAKEKLVLVRQVVDSEGRDRRASVFWDEVAELYRTRDGAATLPTTRLTLMDVGAAAPAYARGRVAARQRGGASARSREAIKDNEILSELEGIEEFSVTELETYLACPRRWFHERAIRPREIDREFDAREAGGLAHRALARFYELLQVELGQERVTAANLEGALGLIDKALLDAEQGGTQALGLPEELSALRTRSRVVAAVRQDAELLPGATPLAHELAFGDDAGAPIDLGGLRVRGRIDRIDRVPSGVLVTDYKTGSVRGWKSFSVHRLIQVPLYAFVSGVVFDTEVVGGVYRSLSSGSLRGFWRPDVLDLCATGSSVDAVGQEGVAGLIEDALALARSAAEGIRAGAIEASANSSGACAFCGLKTVCEARR